MALNLLQLNIQSINNKLDLLEKLFKNYNIDIALIQETWTKPQQIIKIKSYNAIFNSREENRGGGVAIFIKDCYPFYPSEIVINEQVEYVKARVNINNLDYHFISFYNPNHTNINKTIQEFKSIIDQNQNNNTIIGGDINALSVLWNNELKEDRLGKCIADLITTSTFSILNNGNNTRLNLYNHTESALDITLASHDLASRSDWNLINETIGSDHIPILINIQQSKAHKNTKKIVDKTEILKEVNNISMQNNPSFACYTSQIKTIIRANTKIISIDSKKVPKMWWNDYLERLWFIKKEKLKIYNKTKDLFTAMELKKSINKLKLAIKKAKSEAWIKFTNSFSSKTPDEMWKVVKSLKNSNPKNPLLQNQQEIKNFLNHNFPHSFVNFELPFKEKLKPTPFSEDEFQEVLTKAKSTSPGVDNISYELIKNLNNTSQLFFLKMINVEWNKGIFPPDWKIAKVIGINKLFFGF